MNISYAEGYIHQQFNQKEGHGPRLCQILNSGLKQGFPYREVWQAILQEAAEGHVQQAWSAWAAVHDREEIRLRLKALNELKSLDTSLEKFVCFFFHASDPMLYQLSAMILGREMHRRPALQSYFEAYAAKRNIDLQAPIQLNKHRSKRRVLLAIASHIAFTGDQSSYPVPFATEPSSSIPSHSDADTSISFIAASLLLRKGMTECASFVISRLEERFNSPEKIHDRSLIRSAGMVLRELMLMGHATESLYEEMLHMSLDQYEQAHDLATKLQALFLIDELAETWVHLEGSWSTLEAKCPTSQSLQLFIQKRCLYWLERTAETPAALKTIGYPKGNIDISADYVLYAHQIRNLSDEGEWRSQAIEERAFRSFNVIDQSFRATLMHEEEIALLFKSFGLLNRKADRLHEGGLTDRTPLAPVIRQLVALEPSISRHLFDSQLLHRLSDPQMLPVLMPSRLDSEFLPILADAVEHQLRFRLATDKTFDPNHFLYTLSIRKPHSRFYHYLLELCRDREYTTPSGESYPFAAEAERLLAEASRTDSHPAGVSHPTSFGEALTSIRQNLRQLCEATDLRALLSGLSRQLQGTGAEQVRPDITLHDLLEIIQPSGAAWYQSGTNPFTPETGPAILQELSGLGEKMAEKAKKIQQTSLVADPAFSESIQALEAAFEKTRHTLVPLLGAMEATLLNRLLTHASSLLALWEKAYSNTARLWADPSVRRTQIIQSILTIEHAPMQQKLLYLLWTSEVNAKGLPEDAWVQQYDLLIWGAAQTDALSVSGANLTAVWMEQLEAHWIRLLHGAMKQLAEARVAQLVKAEELTVVRNGPEVQERLSEVKHWQLSRYDFFHALKCNKALNGRSTSSVYLAGKTAGEYFGHFAPVWLALLIGVIFMFDFGDPWFELAEIGDIGGVLFAFLFGVTGTFLYVWFDLHNKIVRLPADPFRWFSTFGRVFAFLCVTFVYTFLVVCLFWYMFSSTDQVVQGVNAPLHLLSWTGFALFAGVFLGLIGKKDSNEQTNPS